MKTLLNMLTMAVLMTACGHAPEGVPSRSVSNAASAGKNSLSYEALMRFDYDCDHRSEQLELLEDQVRQRTFYTVDGVDGNEYPDRISKRYFALIRYRIWSLRLGCRGSSVTKNTQVKLKDASQTKPPEAVPRCYFEESTEATTLVGQSQSTSESTVSRRKEVCTNYPLIADTKEIHVGDSVNPDKQLDKNIAYVPNLRKWNGNIFQMVSKTEMHRNAIVKFTVVFMWSGTGWVVVDKF